MLGQQRLPAVQADGGFHCGTWRLLRVEEIDALVAYIPDLRIRGVDQQRGFGKRPEQVSGRTLHLAPVEPRVIVLWPKNSRHAIVDGMAVLASTVMTEKLCSQSPAGLFHASQSPAKAKSGSPWGQWHRAAW